MYIVIFGQIIYVLYRYHLLLRFYCISTAQIAAKAIHKSTSTFYTHFLLHAFPYSGGASIITEMSEINKSDNDGEFCELCNSYISHAKDYNFPSTESLNSYLKWGVIHYKNVCRESYIQWQNENYKLKRHLDPDPLMYLNSTQYKDSLALKIETRASLVKVAQSLLKLQNGS